MEPNDLRLPKSHLGPFRRGPHDVPTFPTSKLKELVLSSASRPRAFVGPDYLPNSHADSVVRQFARALIQNLSKDNQIVELHFHFGASRQWSLHFKLKP